MWSFDHRYTLRALGAVLGAATLATAAQAAPRPIRVNVNFPSNQQQPVFRMRPTNPMQFEAARESSILFNRSLSPNQPIPSQQVFRSSIFGNGSTNPFYTPFPGAPNISQQALNTALTGSAFGIGGLGGLGGVPISPFLGGYPYGGGYGGYGIGSNLYGSGSGGPYSGYLSGGTAAAGSNTLTSYPRSPDEDGRLARIDARRRAFDEYLYERLNAPTHEDLREFTQHESLRRSLNEPPRTEVWSGGSLNTLLADIQKLQGVDKDNVPEIPLDEDLVKRMNVTASGGNGGSMAFLKDGGRLNWPLGVRILGPGEETRELRSQINTLLPDAVAQAANGKVDPGLLQELSRDVNRLQRLLVARANDMPEDTYIDARRFLNNLDDSVRLLRRPDAGDYINGRYAAKGSTIQKLVKYMTEHGLEFGPGVPGEEAAYKMVQQALVRYDSALRMNQLRQDTSAKQPAARTK